MPFEPGVSGNLNGKPPGTRNKLGLELRELITGFLEDNFEKVKNDFTELKPKDRARLYVDLLQFALPKLQSVSGDIQFEKMSDEELERIVETLKKSVLEDDEQ